MDQNISASWTLGISPSSSSGSPNMIAEVSSTTDDNRRKEKLYIIRTCLYTPPLVTIRPENTRFCVTGVLDTGCPINVIREYFIMPENQINTENILIYHETKPERALNYIGSTNLAFRIHGKIFRE